MDWENVLYATDDRPLERLVEGYSHTAVFRTMAFIGDSLSSGEFETRDAAGAPAYHDLYEYSWGQYIARKNGLTAYNFSRGGMTAKDYVERFADEQGLWDRAKACQAYVIALGVNDLFNCHMELGCAADADLADWRNNPPTVMGYYAAIVSRYKAISPDAVFFFVTIPQNDDPPTHDIMTAFHRELYALQARVERSYVIDLHRYGPVYDARFREQFYLHGHMSPAGYLLTAKLIDSYIDYIVRHDPATFRTIGLVNSGIDWK